MPITDSNSFIVALTGFVAGNHKDIYNLKLHLKDAFCWLREQGLTIRGAYFNVDNAFDTREAWKTCSNLGRKPNIPKNKCNRKKNNQGRKQLFNEEVSKYRFN